jgi:hypothetical protein
MEFSRARAIFFLSSFVYLILQLYLFHRVRSYLSRRFHDRRRIWLTGVVGGFFLLMLVPLAWYLYSGMVPRRPALGWARPFSLLFAVWSFGSTGAVLILLGSELLRLLPKLFAPRPAPVDLARRRFLQKGAAAAAVAPFLVSGYGALMARRRFEVEHFDLPMSGLSSDLSQLSIVQLSDIHVGPFMPAEELAAYVEEINRLEPDLIALTGDFIATSPSEAEPCVETLSKLEARYGIFACMGNHDVYAGVENKLTRLFGKAGVRVLRNDAVSLEIKNSRIDVLGIDDLNWGQPDLPRALRTAESKPGELSVLLSHRPEIFPAAAQKGIEVVLSGHYHGGQVKLTPDPRSFSIARFLTPYAEGLYHLSGRRLDSKPDAKDSMLFVSRGIGITALPIRINCPPQIAHLTLRKA